MPAAEMSDADLVALARSGDADGFRVLASRYRAMAMSVALHLPDDRQTAEDLVQEATLAAFVSPGRLRDPDRFRSLVSSGVTWTDATAGIQKEIIGRSFGL